MSRERMQTLTLGQNKLLCFFKLKEEFLKEKDPFPRANSLPILVHHNHYACVYYELIYKFFKTVLGANATKNHIRVSYNGKQLPSNRPIGLYLSSANSGNIELFIELADEPMDDAFNIVFRNWKQGYCIINPKKSADFLIKNLPLVEQREKYGVYARGEFINIPQQRELISLRGFHNGTFVQRFHNLSGTALDLIYQLWPALFSSKDTLKPQYQHAKFSTFDIEFDPKMPIEVFYDSFYYNDGYWYITLKLE